MGCVRNTLRSSVEDPSARPSTLEPFGDTAEQELAAAVIQRLAVVEAPLLGALWPHYRGRKRRYRDRPARLTDQGGGTTGGAGGLDEVTLVLPYVMVAATVALDLLRGVAEEQVSDVVTGWLRRRWSRRKARRLTAAPARALPLTRTQLLRIEAAVARDARKWDLTDEQRSLLVYELRAALIARFGIVEDQDGAGGPAGG
jgi:hypothetical protein